VLLTTYELGDIFLSSLKFSDAELRALSYTEFLQALVRCALVAYSKISESTILDKIRGLFLYMWRSINKNVPRAWDGKRKGSTYTGDLLAGAAIFNRRFTAQWAADGHRDYLAPPPVVQETGRIGLDRVLSNDQSMRHLVGSARGPTPADANSVYGISAASPSRYYTSQYEGSAGGAGPQYGGSAGGGGQQYGGGGGGGGGQQYGRGFYQQ